ncbi:MAG: hypothetical protein ABIP64_07980 [Burkholderiales bacterium]
MKTERMVILVTPEQKATIASKAKALNLSAGEVVRRAVDTYRPNDDEALLNALADELGRSVRESRKALKEALGEVNKTLGHFAAKRAPLRKAA